MPSLPHALLCVLLTIPVPADEGLSITTGDSLLTVAQAHASRSGLDLMLDDRRRALLAARIVEGAALVPAEQVRHALETLLAESGLGLRVLSFGTRHVLAVEELGGLPLTSTRFVSLAEVAALDGHPAELVATAFPLPDLATWRRALELAGSGVVRMRLPDARTGPWNACILWGPAAALAPRVDAILGRPSRDASTRARCLTGVRVVTRPVAPRVVEEPAPAALDDDDLAALVVRVEGAFRLGRPDGVEHVRLLDLLRAYELATWVDVSYRGGTMAQLAQVATPLPEPRIVGRSGLDDTVCATLAMHGLDARPSNPGRSRLHVEPGGSWKSRRWSESEADVVFVDEERLAEWADRPTAGICAMVGSEDLDATLQGGLRGLDVLLASTAGDDARVEIVDVRSNPHPGLLIQSWVSGATTLARVARVALDARDDAPAVAVVPVRGDALDVAARALDRLWGRALTGDARRDVLSGPFLDAPLVVAESSAGPVLVLAPPGQETVARDVIREIDTALQGDG